MKLTNVGYAIDDQDENEAWRLSELIRTPQEDNYSGGSPDLTYVTDIHHFYRPAGVNAGTLTIDQATLERRRREYFIANGFGSLVAGQIAFKYAELDPESGITVQDPFVLGEVDIQNQLIDTHPERDLTAEVRAQIATFSLRNQIWQGRFPILRSKEG